MAQKKPSRQDLSGPPITDFHGRRRELIKLGVEQGHLTWSQIQNAFNQEFINNTEIEVLLFTCEQMGIEIRNRPSS